MEQETLDLIQGALDRRISGGAQAQFVDDNYIVSCACGGNYTKTVKFNSNPTPAPILTKFYDHMATQKCVNKRKELLDLMALSIDGDVAGIPNADT